MTDYADQVDAIIARTGTTTEAPVEAAPPADPGLGLEVIELDLVNAGPPVFDIEVTAPAIPLHVYAVVKRPEVQLMGMQQNQGRLVPRVVFEVRPGCNERVKMRLALVQFGDTIPPDVANDAKHLGIFIHPQTGMPIAVYQVPFDLMKSVDAAIVDTKDIGAPNVEA